MFVYKVEVTLCWNYGKIPATYIFHLIAKDKEQMRELIKQYFKSKQIDIVQYDVNYKIIEMDHVEPIVILCERKE